jgi:hypothetical protein
MKSTSLPRFFLFSILGLLIVLFAGERILSRWLEKRLTAEMVAANISVASVDVSVAGRFVRAHNFKWHSSSNQLQQDSSFVEAEELSLEGISIFHLLRNRSIRIHTLTFNRGKISMAPVAHDTVRKKPELPSFDGLQVGTLRIVHTSIMWRPDSVTNWTADAELACNMIELKGSADPLRIASYEINGDVEISMTNVSRKQRGGFFLMELQHLSLNRDQHTLSCDSLTIIPTYSKLEFAHRKGTQSTWAAVTIPRIEINGLDLNQHQDSTFTASHILISGARVDAFRDRRVPLRRKTEIPLPMTWMRELNLAVEIDTLQVDDMEVVYEHFGEKSFEAGTIRFSNLDGTFLNVINRSYNNLAPVTTLHATANVMTHGKIEASFTFPLEPGTAYRAHGRISRLPLTELNSILESAAFMSIETGHLNDLAFEFRYNNNVSTGSVEVDYKDLKVKGLTKDRDADVDPMKTLITNLALKNNNSKTGQIQTERDKRRFIFHYWAHSLMDGLRDAVVPVAGDRKK